MTTFGDFSEGMAFDRPESRVVGVSRTSWLEWGVSRSAARACQPEENLRQILVHSLYRQLELAAWNTEVAAAGGDLEEAQEENDLADLTMTLLGGVADRSDTPGSATSATQRPVARRSVV